MVTEAPAYLTAQLQEKVRAHVHELPSSYCRRRFLDLALFKREMETPGSLVASRLSPVEQRGVLAERTYLLMKCIVTPEAPPTAAYLYEPKEAAAFTGGTVERQRALEGKIGAK
jgi:hypothetical protein